MTPRIYADVEPHWGRTMKYRVARITKNWIVVMWNEKATGKFSRRDGYSAGAFRYRQSLTPSKVVNLEELNKLAEDNGGTWREPKNGRD